MIIKKVLHIKKSKKMFSFTKKILCIDSFSLNKLQQKREFTISYNKKKLLYNKG